MKLTTYQIWEKYKELVDLAEFMYALDWMKENPTSYFGMSEYKIGQMIKNNWIEFNCLDLNSYKGAKAYKITDNGNKVLNEWIEKHE